MVKGENCFENKNTLVIFFRLVKRSQINQANIQKLTKILGWQVSSKVQYTCYSYYSLCFWMLLQSSSWGLFHISSNVLKAVRLPSNFVYVTSPSHRALMSWTMYYCDTVLQFLPCSLILRASLPKYQENTNVLYF